MTDHSSPKVELPPSLAVKPNIPWDQQTIEQLVAERDYWQRQIDEAPGWGAALGMVIGFRNACDAWIRRRQAAAQQGEDIMSENDNLRVAVARIIAPKAYEFRHRPEEAGMWNCVDWKNALAKADEILSLPALLRAHQREFPHAGLPQSPRTR